MPPAMVGGNGNNNTRIFPASSANPSTILMVANGTLAISGNDTNTSGVIAPANLNATNTGVPSGTSLIAVPGSATSGTGWTWNGYAVAPTGAGVTISGLDVAGGFDNTAHGYANVTVQNSRFQGQNINDWVINSVSAGFVIKNCEVGGGSDGVTFVVSGGLNPSGILVGNGTTQSGSVIGCNIHHVADATDTNGGIYIYQSWTHDLNCGNVGATHADACQQTAGTGTNNFSYSRLQGGNNNCLFPESGNSDWTADNCYFEGGSGPGGTTSFVLGGGYAGNTFTMTNSIVDPTLIGGVFNITAGTLVQSNNKFLNGTAITSSS